jgi:integral membrane sensor domain MASE1
MVKKQEKKQEKKEDFSREQFKVYGHELVEKIKALIKEGNIRRIIIKNEKGKEMMEIPVTFAVVGAFFAPVLAAVGALAALMTKCTIEVERKK